MAHLTLVLQGREVRKFVLNPTVTTIGRSQENDIVINNLALSRRHAEVHHRNGRHEVQDLGSQNGVYVNSDKVSRSRPLQDGDSITLGTYKFVFSAGEADEPDVKGVRSRAMEVTQQLLGKPEKRVEPRTEGSQDLEPEGREGVPLLVLKYNDVELQRFPLRGEISVIGRAKECDIQIAERRLSRRHCEIRREAGDFVLRDLGSQNGTYVNRKKIGESHGLRNGDIINFAEYSVLYLADVAAYDGPDLVHSERASPGLRPTPSAEIEREETEFPPAYAQGGSGGARPSGRSDGPVHPSDLDERDRATPRPPIAVVKRDPFIEAPGRAKERRSQGRDRRGIQERRRDGAVQAPKVVSATPSPRREVQEHHDVDDVAMKAAPDPALDDWFKSRGERSEVLENEEPSVLLERNMSSVSQILSTMMVDKRDLDKNLATRARQRRFVVDVQWGEKKIFSGPLTEPVTILGTDREADIQLKGRYVAGRHSILVRVRDSLLLVRLGSSSAARVNGLPKLQAFLKSGDIIQIDETTIKVFEE